jgi:SAM-dependent methyltransferase
MADLDFKFPNATQIEEWNGDRGKCWLEQHEALERQVVAFGNRAMDRAAIRQGERALDIGCGCGETTLEMSRRVGPAGFALGVDISRILLESAREAARQAELPNLRFEEGDAQTYAFEPASFDLIFSRFGVMFFEDPVAAFRNLRIALRSDGRLIFVCWRTLKESEFFAIPMEAALRRLPPPAPTDPNAPGPTAFANPDRVRDILSQSGFKEIVIDPIDEKVGGLTLERTAAMLVRLGPASRLMSGAPQEIRDLISADVKAALAPLETPNGAVFLGAGAWLATARLS